jgi:hypothetical protein
MLDGQTSSMAYYQVLQQILHRQHSVQQSNRGNTCCSAAGLEPPLVAVAVSGTCDRCHDFAVKSLWPHRTRVHVYMCQLQELAITVDCADNSLLVLPEPVSEIDAFSARLYNAFLPCVTFGYFQ